ncbi:MAG: transposase, partial [Candidatus Omnitrophica bacterium CG_4_9_14_0_2_um_filter_42_8]
NKKRKVWYQYWERLIRTEEDFYTRINYIHNNSIKHGISNSMDDYKFSSYHDYANTKGKEWLQDCFEKYLVIDFSVPEDVD